MKTFHPGDRVRMSGAFLRNTGQHTGSAGLDRFTVVACECKPCAERRWVATDEMIDNYEGGLMPRHIATVNLERVRS